MLPYLTAPGQDVVVISFGVGSVVWGDGNGVIMVGNAGDGDERARMGQGGTRQNVGRGSFGMALLGLARQ